MESHQAEYWSYPSPSMPLCQLHTKPVGIWTKVTLPLTHNQVICILVGILWLEQLTWILHSLRMLRILFSRSCILELSSLTWKWMSMACATRQWSVAGFDLTTNVSAGSFRKMGSAYWDGSPDGRTSKRRTRIKTAGMWYNDTILRLCATHLSYISSSPVITISCLCCQTISL